MVPSLRRLMTLVENYTRYPGTDRLGEAVYRAFHGTKARENFAAFRIDLSGKANRTTDGQQEFPAIWAAEKPEVAAFFAHADPHGIRYVEPGSRVIPVIVELDNPLIVDLEADHENHRSTAYFERPDGRIWNITPVKDWYLYTARDRGHDGVIFRNGYDGWMARGDLYAVFDPRQIRPRYGSGQ
jgi:hypothetical protein